MSTLILAIDDDTDILMVLKANLELHGFEVMTAASWKEAEGVLKTAEPDLIILDIMLPDANGVEICRALRKDLQGVPIIMLTAKDKISDKVIGLESGADDYVVKPFETLELIARIRACLRRYAPRMPEKEATVGTVKVNFQKRTVTVSGRRVALTPKEYELLCFFIEHRGEVLSRDRIRRNVWKGTPLYAWSRVIDVHVQHLRQKIEDDPSHPRYIHTVPGVGYRFDAEGD